MEQMGNREKKQIEDYEKPQPEKYGVFDVINLILMVDGVNVGVQSMEFIKKDVNEKKMYDDEYYREQWNNIEKEFLLPREEAELIETTRRDDQENGHCRQWDIRDVTTDAFIGIFNINIGCNNKLRDIGISIRDRTRMTGIWFQMMDYLRRRGEASVTINKGVENSPCKRYNVTCEGVITIIKIMESARRDMGAKLPRTKGRRTVTFYTDYLPKEIQTLINKQSNGIYKHRVTIKKYEKALEETIEKLLISENYIKGRNNPAMGGSSP